MEMLVAMWLAAQAVPQDCPSTLALTGNGLEVARQVQLYAKCINVQLGDPRAIRKACGHARATVLTGLTPKTIHIKVRRAVSWLDAMSHWRRECETHLEVVE
ncbi:hypothetical protein [Sphingomonas sp. BK580]|uniref:hypothetical protein n=1 Tax=Sphingomonas sp. BK580 TaxID=2586972 RepID=UPI00161C1343|nr:hypothetical protein [Sphingomonas sp. BK580]MBB3692007.1 hypothetical protein [Sphingomonas sp. BK580]